MGVSTFQLNGGTRFGVSDYSHTAHYFAQPDNPATFLQSDSGFDNSLPAAVPLPMSALLLAPSLLLLARRRVAENKGADQNIYRSKN